MKEKALENGVGITPVDRTIALKNSNQAVGWGLVFVKGLLGQVGNNIQKI